MSFFSGINNNRTAITISVCFNDVKAIRTIYVSSLHELSCFLMCALFLFHSVPFTLAIFKCTCATAPIIPIIFFLEKRSIYHR